MGVWSFPMMWRENSRKLGVALLGYEAIGELVLVIGLARKMSREDVAATPNGVTKGIAGLAGLNARRNQMDDFVPGTRVDLLVDTAVGENFDAMLEQRDEY
jgi:hypothetical protein